jgi:hypothetical protein
MSKLDLVLLAWYKSYFLSYLTTFKRFDEECGVKSMLLSKNYIINRK